MKRAVCVVVAVLAAAEPAVAGNYLADRALWSRQDSDARGAAAMGMYDGLALLFADADPATQAIVIGRNTCVTNAHMTQRDLAALIDQGYAQDVTWWPDPAVTVLYRQLAKMCKADINAERVRRKLAPER